MTSFEQLAHETKRHTVWYYQRPGHPENVMVTLPKTRSSASASLAVRFGPLESLRPGGGR